jgi:hypothetical protein
VIVNDWRTFLAECLNRRWLYVDHGATTPCAIVAAEVNDAGVLRQMSSEARSLAQGAGLANNMLRVWLTPSLVGGHTFSAMSRLADVTAGKVDGLWRVRARLGSSVVWSLQEVPR